MINHKLYVLIIALLFDFVLPFNSYLSSNEAAYCCNAGASLNDNNYSDSSAKSIQYKCSKSENIESIELGSNSCKKIAKLCCVQFSMRKLCESLSAQLIEQKHSNALMDFSQNLYRNCEEHPECCDCCELGIKTRQAQTHTGEYTCLPMEHIIGRECNVIYTDCCLRLNLSVILQDHRCPTGFTWNSKHEECRDIDECSLQTHNCTTGYRCENTKGGFKCVRERHCGTGYSVQHETQRCVDIDECESMLHNCGPGMICENLPGTFKCLVPNCDKNGTKFDGIKGRCVQIRCPTGYKLDRELRCRDINECLNDNICTASEICRNKIGSYECVSNADPNWTNSDVSTAERAELCPSGFRFNAQGQRCEDIDECKIHSHNCQDILKDSICRNKVNGYDCVCSDGFEKSNENSCIDINECNQHAVCPYNAECVNTRGSFSCICKQGFRGVKCDEDIDECAEYNPCEHTCVNLKGSYFCLCKQGYTLDPQNQSNCIDIDECKENLYYDSVRRDKKLCKYDCINLNGTYECRCPVGYISINEGETCVDIDECSSTPCDANSLCVNTFGKYQCVRNACPSGYTWVSTNQCKYTGRALKLHEPSSYFFTHIALQSKAVTPISLFVVRMQVPNEIRKWHDFPSYSFRVVDVNTDETVYPAKKHNFLLVTEEFNPWEAELRLVNTISGPQDVYMEVITSFHERYGRGIVRVHSIVKLVIYIGAHEF